MRHEPKRDRKRDQGLRLHHRRRRLGRLRAGQPAEPRMRSARVLLLEAGGRDRNPLIHIPIGLGKLHDYKHARLGLCDRARAQPEQPPHRGDARQGAGRLVLDQRDGLSRAAIRGDYDRWAQKGALGWSYADVLPYFRRGETWQDGENALARRRRPARRAMGQDARSAVRRLDRGGRAAGLPRNRRLQRAASGRLRPQPVLDPRRPALLGGASPICARRRSGPTCRSRPARTRRAC